MTCRELILYILKHGLEDEPVFKDGKFVGFMTAFEAARKMDVGVATVFVWMSQGKLKGEIINGEAYIPADSKLDNTRNTDL